MITGRDASELTVGQRLHHATHGLYGVMIAFAAATIPFGAAALVSMLLQGESVPVPLPLWITATALLVGGFLQRWLVYRRLGAGVREYLGATLASLALTHVIIVANLAAVLRRPARWERTDKFRRGGVGLRALRSVRTEAGIATVLFVLGAWSLLAAGSGVTSMLGVGLLLHAAAYVAAPVLALQAERDLSPATSPCASAGACSEDCTGRLHRADRRAAVPAAG